MSGREIYYWGAAIYYVKTKIYKFLFVSLKIDSGIHNKT